METNAIDGAAIALMFLLLIARRVIISRLSADLPAPDPAVREQRRRILLVSLLLSIAGVGFLLLLPEQFSWVGLAILLPSFACLVMFSGDLEPMPPAPDPELWSALRRTATILLGIKITPTIVILGVGLVLPSRWWGLIGALVALNFVCWSTAMTYVEAKVRRKTSGPHPKPGT